MSAYRGLLAFAALAAATAVACAAPDESAAEPDEDAVDQAVSAAPWQLAVREDPSVLSEHPDTLRALEQKGYDLGTLLSGAPYANAAAFAASREGAALIAAVNEDVTEAKEGDGQLGVGMAFSHRAFDARWLSSTQVSFELVGVANRMDRRHAAPNGCGEIHLVYRLGYANAQAKSRLPMTLMLVYPQAKVGSDCARVAANWMGLPKGSAEGTAAGLAAGPLANLGKANRLELNYQLLRWPSTTRTDMGGHAEYSLRVFARSGNTLAAAPLENTPRTDLTPDEQKALGTWITANAKEIDRGTALLPAQFLATKALSASPKGLGRGQNRPFAQLLGLAGEKLPNVDLAGASVVKSKAALVRRLDTMTCQGCHQARSVAGFHVLGHDRPDMAAVNALIDGFSPHARELADYRKRDLESIAARKERPALPFAERAGAGGYGATCGLGDAGFAAWTCDAGLTCSDINGDDVGICVSQGKRRAGQACEESAVTFSADPHTDKVSAPRVSACELPNGASGRCVRSGGDPGGFPTGMCSGGCATLGKVEGDGICGLAVPSGFNACIGAGKPFEQCVAGGSKQYRRACDVGTPCGQDYVCAAVPGAAAGKGACLPPYFVFQARVDGHLVGR
jgi:hypothetical protein